MGYSFRLTARVLLYAPSHRQDITYHGLCYSSRVALAGTRSSSVGSPHEGSIRRPIVPRANALTTELHLAPCITVKGSSPGVCVINVIVLYIPHLHPYHSYINYVFMQLYFIYCHRVNEFETRKRTSKIST